MEVRPPQIVYGVFRGMGDLLWAVPVITAELNFGHQVHLMLFPSAALAEFCSLLDFGPNRSQLAMHTLPRTAPEALLFLKMCSGLSPKVVWVSPHAPASAASWKVPLAFWVLKTLFWSSAQMVGADTEPMAQLFDRALAVDRSLPLKQREWSMYALLRGGAVAAEPPQPRFDMEIMKQASEPPHFDLIIHPGAMALNRTWPVASYCEVVSLLPREWTIGVLGLPADVEPLRAMLPADRSIVFLTGSLREAVMTLAAARRLLVMDSGNVHFAEILRRPAVALFGKEDPRTIIPTGLVDTVYEKSVPCQPCGLAVCLQTEAFCMTNLSPATVAGRLMRLAQPLPAKDMVSLSATHFIGSTDLPPLAGHGGCETVPGKIGIATVLYNSGEVLPDFLTSLESQTYTNFVVYVVDNASVDDAAERCRLAGDRFVVTINERNTGFAYGTNQGIRQALEDGCEYVLLLNNDVAFEAGFLEELVRGMERTCADIVAPLTFYYDRPDVIWAAGGRFQRWAGYRPQHLGMEQRNSAEFALDRLIQFSPGSGLMAHRRVFERIGLLDETFFTYWEDTDFSVRALKAGLRSYLIPEAKLWHKVSSLTGMHSEFQRFYAVRNHALYISKHCGRLEAALLHGLYLTTYRLMGLLRLRTDERVTIWKKGMEIARTAGYK